LHLQVLGTCICVIGSLSISPVLHGQETAILSGAVVTEKQTGIADAQVTLTDSLHGRSRILLTDQGGLFVFDLLTPGDYSIAATKPGFTSLRLDHVELPTRGRRSVQLLLKEGAPETIEKRSERTAVSNADGSQAAYLDPSFFLPLPLPNRNVASLVYLTPSVEVPQNPGDQQQAFDVNGNRPSDNYFLVDGVADTTPVAGDLSTPFLQAGTPPGSLAAPPTSSAFLTLPLDALQDVAVQTLAFAPEFGALPGAQVAMTTRTGTSELHGSAYDYTRNTSLDANEYFANSAGLRRPSSTQNRYGATLGGALEQSDPKTFYFLWFEGLNSKVPQTLYNIVPDSATRTAASAQLLPYLSAFPVANGPELTQGTATFAGAVADPLKSKSFGVRFDRTITQKWRAFLRYGYSDWDGQTRGTEETAANVFTSARSLAQTLTAGLLYNGANSKTTDIRVNYSVDQTSAASSMDGFGGATPLSPSLIFPSSIVGGSGTFDLSIIGATGYAVNGYRKVSDQRFDVEDGNAILLGTHEYKVGFDVRRIASTYNNLPYASSFIFNGVDAAFNGGLLSGQAINSIITSSVPKVYPTYLQLGAYAQDTWKAGNGLTIIYGARYDINPAPRARSGLKPYAIDGNGFLTTNLPLYLTQWKNIAPRVSVAYQVSQTPGSELTVRGGFGVFYDTSYGSVNSAFQSAPYQSSAILTNPAFPTTLTNQRPPSLTALPYGIVSGVDNGLTAPRLLEYHIAVERNLGEKQTLSLSYVASSSSNVTQNLSTPAFSSQYDLANQVEGVGTSSYKAGKIEFRRRFSDAFQMLASYTLSHSVDTASTDIALGGAFATIEGTENGDSNFDARNLLKISGSFGFPVVDFPIASTLTKDWHLDFNGTYRSGLPFNILTLTSVTSASTDSCTSNSNSYCSVGVYSEVRPNQLQQGVWLPLPGTPGGQELYAPAFSIPSTFAQGDTNRNSLRGESAWQVDLALRRRIALRDGFSVTIAAEAFNVFNRPSLANPIPYVTGNLSSPNFGTYTQSLQSGFGGMSPYGLGTPRTMEFTLRVQF
jgi:hypothetical protein